MTIDSDTTRTSRFSYENKYIRYREEYERARDFSSHLDNAKAPESSQKPDTSDKPDKKDSKPAGTGKNLASENKSPSSADPSDTDTPSPAADSNISYNYSNTGAASGSMIDRVKQYEPHIRAAATRYDLPPELIAGVIYQESRGNSRAVSHCGAMGLMQLMPQTAANLGVGNAFDPAQNIDGGAKYLRQLLDKFGGRADFAVAAYNAGPGNVSKFNGIPPFKETQDYVPKVLGYANSFKVANAFVQTTSPTAVRV
jgi:transglycosylase-like protein with SLT domain